MSKFKKIILIFILLLVCVVPVQASELNYIVYDLKQQKILAAKNQEQEIDIGYFGQLAVALTSFEAFKENDLLLASVKAIDYGQENAADFSYNEEIPYLDLLHAILLAQKTDASNIIAENTSANFELFTTLLNNKMTNLGLKNTIFDFPYYGNIKTNTSDLLKLVLNLLFNERVFDILKKESYEISKTNKNDQKVIKNTFNKKDYPEFSFGYCDTSKGHLFSYFEDDNLSLLILVTGAKNEKQMYDTARNLIKEAEKDYIKYNVKQHFDSFSLQFKKDELFHTHDVSFYLTDDDYVYHLKNQKVTLETRIIDRNDLDKMKAFLEVYINGKLEKSIELKKDVKESKFNFLNYYVNKFSDGFNILSCFILIFFVCYIIYRKLKKNG